MSHPLAATQSITEQLGSFLDSLPVLLEESSTPEKTARESIKAFQALLMQAFEQGVDVRRLVALKTKSMDLTLVALWENAKFEEATSLVAVGGYGREELHPNSDIDLLILTEEEPSEEENQRIAAFVTRLWDLNLDIGSSVRSISQCVENARDDVTIATNLVEMRLLTGSEETLAQLSTRVFSDEVYTSKAFFLEKRQEQFDRHRKFAGSDYNLEPNIKSSKGTLRDIQTLAWITKRHFGPEATNARDRYGFITDDEFELLLNGETFLWQLRFGLHMVSKRGENRLLFDYQRTLADILGYQDTDEQLGVEQLMQHFYRVVNGLGELTDVILQYFDDYYLNPDQEREIELISKRFQINNGYIETVDAGVFERSPYALIEIFLIIAQNPSIKGVRATTIRQMRQQKFLIDDSFRNELANTSLFMELLRTPHQLDQNLGNMLKYNVLGRYIPEMGKITGQMQHDLFHVYTVDVHTLHLIRHLVHLFDNADKLDTGLAGQVIETIPKREVMYVAALFHDIGKGRGGDHSELGAIDAAAFCERHHFGERDTLLVTWLVENHLLMSMVAQRQDIADPDIIHDFARKIPSLSHLEHLYVLTVCDIAATNPSLWTSWRSSLLQQLFVETRRAIRRGIDRAPSRAEWARSTRIEVRNALFERGLSASKVDALFRNLDDEYFLHDSTDELVWQTEKIIEHGFSEQPLVAFRDLSEQGNTGHSSILVYIPSKQDLFAATTAVLEQLDLNVLYARVGASGDRFSLSTFIVSSHDNHSLDRDPEHKALIKKKLIEELDDPEDYPEIIDRRMPRQLKHFTFPTEVTFSNDTINHCTVMEVVSPDRSGLLARIGKILLSFDLTLSNAKITTLGERVEDVFFITEADGKPISDPATCATLAQTIKDELDEESLS